MNIPEQIGSYILKEEIGQGGSSRVWLAQHARLSEHKVAVKVLMSQEREAITRFQREAAIAARLRHPNIVRLYDFGYSQPFFYTIMEYIPGASLRRLIEQQGRLPLDAALGIFRQIAAALDYAHSLGIIHRDVAPGNILIEQESDRALLTDFGIARENGQSITISNAIMGTPGFFSPEHIQGSRAVTRLSDLYSLGVVLYHMLSGQMPWDEPPGLPDNPGFSPPAPLRERGVANLPGDVDRVLQTMLALDPSRRFPTARAVVDELDRIFTRHKMTTQIVLGAATAAPTPGDFSSVGVSPNDVETILGPSLIRAPIDRAHQRAEEMRSPATITALLDSWAQQHPLRIRLLGRMARLHKISSANVYFYRLRLLYEHRSPAEEREEPDHHAKTFVITAPIDRWKVELPAVTDFSDHPGDQVILPGSTQVVKCKPCDGRGLTTCPRCRGKQRVMITRPVAAPVGVGPVSATPSLASGAPHDQRAAGGRARNGSAPTAAPAAVAPPPRTEQALVPCPECSGRGGITCERCEGVGRLIQRKIFRWRRRSEILRGHDDRPALDEAWLHRVCKAEVIYSERESSGFRPEWSTIAGLAPLLAEAQQPVDADTRIVLSELTISFIPVTDIVFDLGKPGDSGLYKLSIYGFENLIPADWRFFNWGRVNTIASIGFMFVICLILAFFLIF